ncbi:MAG: hypothetical protein FWG57_01495 [Endomicrobia bacterium]|nr:hypothetical protein [Endomicrobiia bacterium]
MQNNEEKQDQQAAPEAENTEIKNKMHKSDKIVYAVMVGIIGLTLLITWYLIKIVTNVFVA